ncbi:hypothetical protein [Enterococcus sp. GC40]|uniref:hypothetical protein n=1 Tax=Enterococcus sp. GC40 TaxID=3231359 RepID=UPI0034A0A532
MIIKHDLSAEGIKNFEREHLLYTIDEMLRMDNKRRWAELTVITHFENWTEDDKKVNTAQTLMYLIEIDKGRLDCPMGRDMSYIEQYLLVKWAKEGVPTVKIANRTRRDPNTLRRILRQHNIETKARTAPKPVVIVTRDGQRLDVDNAKQASETEWCDITANALRVRLCKHRVYSNKLATIYYKEDEEKWN